MHTAASRSIRMRLSPVVYLCLLGSLHSNQVSLRAADEPWWGPVAAEMGAFAGSWQKGGKGSHHLGMQACNESFVQSWCGEQVGQDEAESGCALVPAELPLSKPGASESCPGGVL